MNSDGGGQVPIRSYWIKDSVSRNRCLPACLRVWFCICWQMHTCSRKKGLSQIDWQKDNGKNRDKWATCKCEYNTRAFRSCILSNYFTSFNICFSSDKSHSFRWQPTTKTCNDAAKLQRHNPALLWIREDMLSPSSHMQAFPWSHTKYATWIRGFRPSEFRLSRSAFLGTEIMMEDFWCCFFFHLSIDQNFVQLECDVFYKEKKYLYPVTRGVMLFVEVHTKCSHKKVIRQQFLVHFFFVLN